MQLPPARRRTQLHQGRRHEGRRIVARKVTSYLTARYTALELCGGKMRRAHPGPVYDRQRPRRRLLVYTNRTPSTAMRGSASPGSTSRSKCRWTSSHTLSAWTRWGSSPPQRLSRRRHEGAPAHGQELRPDRVRAGGGGKGEVADPRRVSAHVLAGRGRRRTGRAPACTPSPARPQRAGYERPRTPQAPVSPRPIPPPGASEPAIPTTAPPPAAPAPAAPTPAKTQHGVARFSSVFGTRRR